MVTLSLELTCAVSDILGVDVRIVLEQQGGHLLAKLIKINNKKTFIKEKYCHTQSKAT